MVAFKNAEFRDEVQGARCAGTGMYVLLHEDSERYATQQFARKMDFL
jgi:hypothetical protein